MHPPDSIYCFIYIGTCWAFYATFHLELFLKNCIKALQVLNRCRKHHYLIKSTIMIYFKPLIIGCIYRISELFFFCEKVKKNFSLKKIQKWFKGEFRLNHGSWFWSQVYQKLHLKMCKISPIIVTHILNCNYKIFWEDIWRAFYKLQ